MNPSILHRALLSGSLVLTATALVLGFPNVSQSMSASREGVLPQPLPLFPSDNWWNLDISTWPVDPSSASFISYVNNGGTRHLHPDFGGNAPTAQDPDACYGMTYGVVSGVAPTDLVAVEFDYSTESDGVNHATGLSYPFYPIPPEAITQPYWVEGGDPGQIDLRNSQDRHLIIVDQDRNYLYELYNVFYDTTRARWFAGSGAFFDMNTNNRRPDGWTSSDAAGLAILPGLVRYDEVYDPAATDIGHAFRVTVRATQGYVYPASHQSGSTAGALPMGARLRLKASIVVTQKTSDPNAQKILRAMQKYGLIVADNGSDMYITGTYDPRWNNDILNPAFSAVTASDFEVIQLGFNPGAPTVALNSVSASPTTVTGGQSATGTVNLTGPAPAGGLVISLSSGNLAAAVPGSVTVSAGATAVNFGINTAPVAAAVTVTITASNGTVVKTTSLKVNPTVLSSLSLSPSSVTGGSAVTGKVTLSAPAPAQGAVVALSSSKPSIAAVPTSVTVVAGKTSASFILRSTTVSANTSASVSASYGGMTKNATLVITKRKR